MFLQCVHGPKGLKREFSLFFVFDQMNSVGLLYYINNVHAYKIKLYVLPKNSTSFQPVAQAHTHSHTDWRLIRLIEMAAAQEAELDWEVGTEVRNLLKDKKVRIRLCHVSKS